MWNAPIDDEKLLEVAPKHIRFYNNTATYNYTRIAEEMNLSLNGVKGALKRLAREGRLGAGTVLPGFHISQTSEQLDDVGNVQKTWIKQKPAGEPFEIPEGHEVKGISALVGANGETIQSWVKTKASPVGLSTDAIKAEFSEFQGRSAFIEAPPEADYDLATLYPSADAHVGLLSWGKETGEDYDLDIAKKTIERASRDLVSSAPRSSVGIILRLGDNTHTNDSTNSTPASGHVLDVDGRFSKIMRVESRLNIELVQLALTKHERVVLRILGGNHDPNVALLMTIAMELYFQNNPRVYVDPDPSEFFKFTFGKCLIVGNHGHKVKAEDLPGMSAAYWPEDWGKSTKRYAFSGHRHHARVGEKHGMRWETLRAIAAKDSYAHSHGYSSQRDMTAITFHKERGEVMRATVPLN